MRLNSLLVMCCVASILGACDMTPELSNGFELVDGGGSKLSLAKDGIILINYTVTGLGKVEPYTIVESRPYNSETCEYFVVDNRTRAFSLLHVEGASSRNSAIRHAIQAVRPINRRSCKTS